MNARDETRCEALTDQDLWLLVALKGHELWEGLGAGLGRIQFFCLIPQHIIMGWYLLFSQLDSSFLCLCSQFCLLFWLPPTFHSLGHLLAPARCDQHPTCQAGPNLAVVFPQHPPSILTSSLSKWGQQRSKIWSVLFFHTATVTIIYPLTILDFGYFNSYYSDLSKNK